MSPVKVLVLIDGMHTKEILDALARLVDLRSSELLLAYVEGPEARHGLDLVRHRPGGAGPLPYGREQELSDAEAVAAGTAMSDAEEAARAHGAAFEAIRLSGKAGEAICGLAERRHPDLVVVRAGGPDRPPIGPGSLGKAAKFIADHSRVPVLLLRTS